MNRSGLCEGLPKDIRINRIVRFDLHSKRSKFVGKNSRLDVHGDSARDRMVRLYTNANVDGIGACAADRKRLAGLLGKNPFDCYRESRRAMTGPLGAGTMPLWDLAGKFMKKPVYELLGGAGPERVPVYDGSVYFSDLLPDYAPKWRDRFREEVDASLANGHRAFKVKIGRGARWMDREEGVARDVAVMKWIRKCAGANAIIGVDANNAYDLAGAKRFLEQVGDERIAFAEELFPEAIDDCLALKEFIHDRGWKTLVADGETQGKLEAFKPFIAARAIDVLQGDMRRFGFEGILTEAAWAREEVLQVAPHNWGSLVGYYMQLHVGRAITNFYMAEHDPLSSSVLIADGYNIKDGRGIVPGAPGFGLSINEARFDSETKVLFDLRA